MYPDSDSLTNRCLLLKYLIYARKKELEDTSSKELILFMGPPGVGKSTLISYLLGVPLKSVKLPGSLKKVIMEEDESSGIRHPTIGHSVIKSCTTYPEAFLMQDYNNMLCDTAGLEEKNPQIRLLTEIFIKKCKRLKAIVIVLTTYCISYSRGSIFKQLIKQLLEIFQLYDIMDRLVFVFNKSAEDLILKDLYEFLCDLYEGEDAQKDTYYMRMLRIIMHRGSQYVMKSLENFEKYNLICTSLDLTTGHDFKTRFLNAIECIVAPPGQIKILKNIRTTSIFNHIQRKIALYHMRMEESLKKFPIFTCYLKLKTVLNTPDPIERIKIINEAYFLKPTEIRKIIGDMKKYVERAKNNACQVVDELVVTNIPVSKDGKYYFETQLKYNYIPTFNRADGEFHLTYQSSKLIKGWYVPGKTGKDKKIQPATIEFMSNESDKLIQYLVARLDHYNRMLYLSEKFHSGLIGEISYVANLENDKLKSQEKLCNFIFKMETVLTEMMLQMPSAKTYEIYEQLVFLASWLNVPPNKIESTNIKYEYFKNKFFVCDSQEELKFRCCTHQHPIELPLMMNCRHWADERCYSAFNQKKNSEKKLYCGICRKDVQPEPVPVVPEEIKAVFESFRSIVLYGKSYRAR